ncbi:hypothetical protein BJX68DRAFT_227663 [Aspergillus pseudodeflectus]|uniref:Uncharacterized protein n=1 Tax=Aspergillus pseudodeflectus TaxID=176178 RepID=A0ABR4L3E2_9EURO
MADHHQPPAYTDPSPDPPPYDFATDPPQPFNQQLLNPQLIYNTFLDETHPDDSQPESRSCRVDDEALATIFFVVVIGLVILLPGLQGEGLGSRSWPLRTGGPG